MVRPSVISLSFVVFDLPHYLSSSSLALTQPSLGPPSSRFRQEFNDSLAVTYLASVQKSAASVNNLADKFMVAFGNRRPI